MQNIFRIFVFSFIFSLMFQSQAGPIIVGNGAGISEQNLYFTFQNSEWLTEMCLKSSSCSLSFEEKKRLNAYVTEIKNASLIWNRQLCDQNLIQENQWMICSHVILRDDTNQDGYLDLGESFQLLVQMFLNHENVDPETADSLKLKLKNHFNLKSFHFPYNLKDKFQFHIFGFKDQKNHLHLFIQNQNSDAVKMDQMITSRLSCPMDLEISTPFVIDKEVTAEKSDILIGFPVTEFCDPNSITGKNHRLIFNLRFQGNQIEIE